ncbi:MAG: M55 family metallopeptidase [Chloroflexi bacterium]|nr:M55 family metallopeptidase [Chloroflexota bacterium]MDQ3406556.1 M55 family metallopeptidase [Chloroflexota bacterium]
MRIYLSVDMEGIGGVSHAKPTGRDDSGYAAACRLMEGETNAAIEGAFDGGATEVVVNDSHGSMYNLAPENIDRRARLVQGRKPLSMVEAAAHGRYDMALFVGYHARAGHPRGTIAHTYTGAPTLTTIDGRPVGEYGINGLYLGGLGVAVGLVTGDDALAEEVAEWLPWAERVVVKRAVSWQAADSLHPAEAAALVRAGARRAVQRVALSDRDGLRPLIMEPPIVVGLELAHAGQADFAAVIPGFTRDGDRGLRYEAADSLEAYRAFVSAVRMAGLADQ